MPATPGNETWRSFFAREGARLYLFARQQCRSAADAEDVLQEALVKVWKQLGRGDRVAVMGAIRRAALDRYRREGRRERREEGAAADYFGGMGAGAEEPWFAGGGEDRERREALERAVRELPNGQREVVVGKIWGGITFEELGQVLGIPAATAASRYRSALGRLKAMLETNPLP